MALPRSAIRPASSSSDTTSSPRSGFVSKGGGTRRGVRTAPDIGGTLLPASATTGPGRRLQAQAPGGAADLAAPSDLGPPDLPPGHGQDPLHRGGVGRVGAG